MSSVGTYGDYGQPGDIDYPLGPTGWNAGLNWPLRTSKRVYANDLNQQLSQPVSFLSRKPMFKGTQQQNSQVLTYGAQTPISLDTEIADAWYMHRNDPDPTQINIPATCDGIWLVQGSVPFAASASGNYVYQANLFRNGQIVAGGDRLGAPGIHVSSGVADLIALSAGDAIQLMGYHNYKPAVSTYINTYSGGATQWSDNTSPVLTARWVAVNNNIPYGVMTSGLQTYQGPDGPYQVPGPYIQLGIPNPGTWSSLQEATSSQFNSDIRNSVLSLANVPVMRASVTGTPASLATATPGQVTGMTAQIDNWGQFANNTWTCPLNGLYLVMGATAFGQGTGAYISYTSIHAVQSGTTTNYQGAETYSYWPGSMFLRALRFSAGDTVQLYGYQASGSSLPPDSRSGSRLFTLWMSK